MRTGINLGAMFGSHSVYGDLTQPNLLNTLRFCLTHIKEVTETDLIAVANNSSQKFFLSSLFLLTCKNKTGKRLNTETSALSDDFVALTCGAFKFQFDFSYIQLYLDSQV